MRLRRFALPFLLTTLLALAFPATAQDTESPALTPFTDEAFSIQGVAPEGWEQVGPGLYARQATAGDITLLAQQAAPVSLEQLWPTLLPQLALTEIPTSTGTYPGGAFEWTLYKVNLSAGGIEVAVDLALHEADGMSYIVLLQGPPEEYEALHSGVFLPVLDAFAPLETTPVDDLPYTAEEVTFPNDDITLAGTLTLPEGDGPHPAVVLISGSGPQDRDEYLGGGIALRPFAVIADHLTRAGIAVLRYDDRGVGQSTGDHAAATSADFAGDAAAAVAYLQTRPEINAEQIGLLGHSEGGLIAAYVGARNPDVAFIISMAGTAVSGADVLTLQNERIMTADGNSPAVVEAQLNFLEAAYPLVAAEDNAALEALARQHGEALLAAASEEERAEIPDEAAFVEQQVTAYLSFFDNPWARFFLTYNPGDDWAQITVPVLAVFGELDLQVIPEQNAPALEAALTVAGNEDFTIVTIPQANHLFQTAESGSPNEYAALAQEFDPAFLPLITDWLLERVTLAP
jgi:hypothetical protein